MPHYRVLLTAMCDCVIEADTEEEAMDIAIANTSSGDYQFEEGNYGGELNSAELDSYLRHCDFKSLAN